MVDTAVGNNTAGLNTRATRFARSAVVELIGGPHLKVFQQERFIPPNNELNVKLILSTNDFVCKSAAPTQRGQQANYKFVIQSANLIVRTKKLTSTAHKALINRLLS